MKTLISATIDSEIVKRLKTEPNQSALIEDLLRSHFSISKEESLESSLKSVEEQKKIAFEKFQRKIAVIKEKMGERERTEEENKEIRERFKQKEESFKDSAKLNFREIAKREMTDEEFLEFKEKWNNNEITSLFEFIKDKEDQNGTT